MSGVHPDLGELGPELRRLAQTMLDKIDPAVRAAATLAAGDGPGKCQQVWCPVCALVALMTGEQHPLLTIIGEHSVALLGVIRSVLNETGDAPSPSNSPGDDVNGSNAGPPGTGYQRIPVTIEE